MMLPESGIIFGTRDCHSGFSLRKRHHAPVFTGPAVFPGGQIPASGLHAVRRLTELGRDLFSQNDFLHGNRENHGKPAERLCGNQAPAVF